MLLRKLNLLDVLFVCRNLRDEDRREIFATRSNDDPDALAIEVMTRWGGFGHVILTDAGKPAALLGATEHWPGRASAWCFGTGDFDEVAPGMTRFIKRHMIQGLHDIGIERCDAWSIEGHSTAHAWLRHLGFVEEARLRRYGRNGEDFLVFRRDRDVQAKHQIPEHVPTGR